MRERDDPEFRDDDLDDLDDDRGLGAVADPRCRSVRESLSAGLDAEVGPLDEPAVGRHLEGCAPCRAWRADSLELDRRLRDAPRATVPDRTDAVVAAVLADRAAAVPVAPDPVRPRPGDRLLRVALAAAAAAQVAVVVPALLLGEAGDGVPPHTGRELGAFGLALAVGFALAALRPVLARGVLVGASAATALLVVVSVADTIAAETTTVEELPHLVTVVGTVLLALLARRRAASRLIATPADASVRSA